jgi:O-antigen biosynthesis protein
MKEKSRSAVGMLDRQLNLPFDQYQRYRLVADAIERLREGSDPLRILDVGGGEGLILKFLPEDQITILDQSDTEEVPGFVKGDATALPFEDEAFDYVVSVDLYEHIEPESRKGNLSELRRTARRGVLLAAPFDSDVVRAAERVANEFHRSVHFEENVWLKEHAENGLPQLDGTREFFEGRGDSVSVLPNGYILHWLAMMCLTFYSSNLEGELVGLFDHANAFYNEFMYGLDNAEPCYRHLLVCLKESADTNLDELVSSSADADRTSQSSALFSTLSVMLLMNVRLVQQEGALTRKEAQVNDLSRRLAERVSAENNYRTWAEQRMAKLQQDHNRLQQDHNRLQQDRNNLKQRTDNLERQRDQLQQELTGVTNSRGWRLLTVVHKLTMSVGRIFRSG